VQTTCEVGDTANPNSCPMPECKAFDHHDHKVDCELAINLINNDNNALSGKAATCFPDEYCSSINRNLRSMWELTYSAMDDSLNKAENVSFSVIVRDTKKPDLKNEFGNGDLDWTVRSPQSSTPCTNTDACTRRAEVESCNIGTNFGEANTGACTWKVSLAKGSLSSFDAYDKDVTDLIEVKLVDPDGAYVVGAAATGTLSSQWNGEQYSVSGRTSLDINTQKLGEWKIEYQACDRARDFGLNGDSNCFYQSVTVDVTDNRVPLININQGQIGEGAWQPVPSEGGGPGIPSGAAGEEDVLECKVDTYIEAGALCTDLRDQYVQGSTNAWVPEMIPGFARGKVTGAVNWEKTGSYEVHYDCEDILEHEAATQTRNVNVVDTRPPTIELLGNQVIYNSAGSHVHADTGYGGSHPASEGEDGLNHNSLFGQVDCEDTCDASPSIDRKLFYGASCSASDGMVGDGTPTNFPEFRKGVYSLRYTCTDYTGLTDVACRTIHNEDHTKPVITVLGSDHMTLEATKTGNYIDDGATCSDEVDGVISQNVEVSGDVVNLACDADVCKYHVKYECKDEEGHVADPAFRTVYVKQTSCPTCELLDCTHDYVAGPNSPLSEKKKLARTATPTFEGCTINQEAHYPFTDPSALCKDPLDGVVPTLVSGDFVNVTQTGKYLITYRAKNKRGLWNDGICRGRSVKYVRTVHVVDTMRPVIRLRYRNKLVAKSQKPDTGVHFEHNTAYDSVHDPPLMSEHASSANVWALSAAAAAMTGLALLAVSRKRAVVAVPV